MSARRALAFAVAIGATAIFTATMQGQTFQGQNTQGQNAQGQNARGQRHEVAKPVLGETANSADAQIAGCLIVDNQGEISLGKVAEQRAKDKDVKQFAQMMVKDHTEFMQQLERFAGNERGTATNESQSSSEGSAQAATTPMGNQHLNFVQLKQQIGQKCLDMVKKDLEEKEGGDFDKCYIGQQIGAHMQVLAELEVVRNHASSELASVLDKGISTTKSHLEEAQKIAKALERG